MDQKVDFCTTSDGVRICYAQSGSGPPLVKAPNWMTHIQFDLESPVWKHVWEALSRSHTFIRFDQRGSGLSDRNIPEHRFEDWVLDLESVVDAVGLDRFDLLGISQGAPIAVEYAARHPERVKKLVLHGGYALGSQRRPNDTPAEMDALQTLMRIGWGGANPAYRQIFTSRFIPDATREQFEWFNELERISSSPENAAMLVGMFRGIDVQDRTALVKCPTLVTHARDDQVVSSEAGRYLASSIPGAQYVEFEGRNHLILENDPSWPLFINCIEDFLGGNSPPVRPESAATTGSADRRPFHPVERLTARELDVLGLIALGNTNSDIADELVIAPNTVANHVKRILSKTGTSNRTEAAAYAIASGVTRG
ncbi:MAG: alpha/beta fold hydrolase [Chloroflexi bacterium]|nr:alpha/beta fold hydrolase [Chloroflexota bacterium]MCH8235246.1 alpha/beta fold hydrolase [Chloroflexota bacterium]MCH8816564.1 alpha/beta fold hydrolase [Chloroflexota bacterium]